MRMKESLKVALSLVLCLALTLSSMTAFAVGYDRESGDGETIEAIRLTPENRPDAIPEACIEENNHIARLISEEQDLNSIVLLNEDDTATLYYFEEPVKFIDENNRVKDKSNQLYSAFDEPQFALEYSYFNKDNDIRTYFPKELSQDSGILLTTGEEHINLSPVTAAQSMGVKTDSGSGDMMSYRDAFGTGTRLEYTPTFAGFKEEIVLSEYTHNEFSFLLDAGGLTPVLQNNQITLCADSGQTVFTMDPIYVYDSSKGESQDGYCHNTWNNVVGIQLVGGNQYKITLSVDNDFLTDSRTEYPVYIDPSFTVNTSGSGRSKSIQDVPVYDGKGARNIASGSNTYGLVGYAGKVGGKDYGVGRLLMRFPGLLNNATYKAIGAKGIIKATLSIKELSGQSTRATIYANQYSGTPWTESSATYGNTSWNGYESPSTTASVGSSAQTTVNFDITKIVQGWKERPYKADKGIILRNANEKDASYRKDFLMTEGASKPEVSITYVFYGCKPYVTENSDRINCHGYACFTRSWPEFLSGTDKKYLFSSSTTVAQALERTKSRMTAWLNANFRGRWKEVSGDNVSLAANQWLIVMRVGKKGMQYDYHFWYRTNNGPWANKHGSKASVLLPASDKPTTDSSSGWAAGVNSRFYSSKIIYYVLTQ